jgi:hypothetical protein
VSIRSGKELFDALRRKAVAGSLVGALLTSACAGSVPRLAPPPDFSAADRKACRALAEKAKAGVRGGSVWESAALGAGAGTGVAVHGVARSNVSSGTADGLAAAAFSALMVPIAAAAGAGTEIARGMNAREAAYGDAMDACLRPAILARELGPEHLEVAYSLHALGYRYARQSDVAAAEALYLRALAIQERTLGAEAPELATTLDDYAALLRQTGRVVEAAEVERRATAIRGRR